MKAHLDSFWVLLLASQYKPSSSQNCILLLSSLACLAWLVMALVYWAYPGGHAWGRYYYWNNNNNINNRGTRVKPIPGPRGLPFVGSMNLMMSSLAHHQLASTAEKFEAKRLMAISLGETRVIVTSDSNVAKELLSSSVFADRPVKEAAYSLMFDRAIGFAPYGVYWRTLRRIAATHLFCPKQISRSERERFDIVTQMASLIASSCNTDDGIGVVRVRDILKQGSLSNMMCSVFGREMDSSNCAGEELSRLVEDGYEILGKLNWSDHLPWLSRFDPQQIRFRCSKLMPKVNWLVNRIISEHKPQTNTKIQDFVDVLLSLQGPDRLSDQDMIAVLWEMIFRGTDTMAVLIEWILARMVLHQDIQSKVQDELDKVVGKSRPVTESDIPAMVYLQAVVKEVLRLHPPGPLLSWARLAIIDTTIDGYHVPAGTTAMVNMWAITRDPDVWSDPLKFLPDRFMTQQGDKEFSVFGSDLRLAPFGSGRRACPGKTLGLTTVTFWVASLLHEFEWIESERNPVDLLEVLRLSCEMVNPLTIKVRPRRR